ncbi:MAG: hypothetical protein H7325_07470 [Pedobacter sp.]|nr:hypothetical protein [Pedobacter sp.]
MTNVFLGTWADHAQISPATSYPFGMMSIGSRAAYFCRLANLTWSIFLEIKEIFDSCCTGFGAC